MLHILGPAQKAGLQQPLAPLDVEGRLDQPRPGRGHRGAGRRRRHCLTAPPGEYISTMKIEVDINYLFPSLLDLRYWSTPFAMREDEGW